MVESHVFWQSGKIDERQDEDPMVRLQVFGNRRGITEKKMFGGVCVLLDGNMCVGIWKSSLIVRLGAEQAAAALAEPNVVEFDITGRPMKGWTMVEPDGLETDEQLAGWMQRAVDFVLTLPKK